MLTYGSKSTRSPRHSSPKKQRPLKFQKSLTPGKCTNSKFSSSPKYHGEGRRGGGSYPQKCVLFGSASLKVSVLFDVNSNKKCVVLFCVNTLKVSELFHMNSKIIPLLFSKSCIPVNLLKTEVLYRYQREGHS